MVPFNSFCSRLQRFPSHEKRETFVHTRVNKTLPLTGAKMNYFRFTLHTFTLRRMPNLATIGGWDKSYAFHVKPLHACVNGGFSRVIRLNGAFFTFFWVMIIRVERLHRGPRQCFGNRSHYILVIILPVVFVMEFQNFEFFCKNYMS